MSERNQNPPHRSPHPESIREFEDRSAQWLFEEPENVRGLIQIQDPALAQCLDFARAERVNRTFVPADLRKKESDLIFRVPFVADAAEGGGEVWVFVLLEHQSEPDPLMGLRLYLYMGQVWDMQRRQWGRRRVPAAQQRLRPIIPLVFYTGENRWEVPIGLAHLMDLPVVLERFVPRWETLFMPLHATPAEALTQFATAIGWALRVWQAEKVPAAELEHVPGEAMVGLEGLSDEQAAQWARVATFFVQLIAYRREEMDLIDLVLAEVRQSKFREKEEVAKVGMTIVERVAAEAHEQTLRTSLKTVLTSRFGALPAAIDAAIEAANSDVLAAWLPSAATAPTLEEVGILPVQPAH